MVRPTSLAEPAFNDCYCLGRFCQTTGPDCGGYRGAVAAATVRCTVAGRNRAAEAVDGCDAVFIARRWQKAAAVPGGGKLRGVRRAARRGAAGGRCAGMHPL